MNNDFLLYLVYSCLHIKPVSPTSPRKYIIVSSQLILSILLLLGNWIFWFSETYNHNYFGLSMGIREKTKKKVVFYRFLTWVRHPITVCIDLGQQY